MSLRRGLIKLKMADEALAKAGLYFDELNKVRLLKPSTTNDSVDLLTEGREVLEKLKNFEKVIEGLQTAIENLGKLVEKEKLKAIGSRNALNSVAGQNDADKQQLQTLIREKTIELERLRVEHESNLREEMDQRYYMQQFLTPL